MKFYKLLILLLIYFAQTQISYSDVAHYVDFKYVLNKSDAGAKAQKSLKNKLESGVKSLNKKQSPYLTRFLTQEDMLNSTFKVS